MNLIIIPLNPGKNNKIDDQQRINIYILNPLKGIKINPETNINNGSNKIDSIDFSFVSLTRKALYLDTKCQIPPGKYL